MEAGFAREEVTLDSPIVGGLFPWNTLEIRLGRRVSRPPATSWWRWLGLCEDKHTLREVVRAGAPHDWHWTPERIWNTVAAEVAKTIGIPTEMVLPEADFYADLGMS